MSDRWQYVEKCVTVNVPCQLAMYKKGGSMHGNRQQSEPSVEAVHIQCWPANIVIYMLLFV